MSLPELSSADLSAITGILTLALSADPSQRTPAERAIHTHLTHHPAPFILALTTLLTSSPDESIRSLSSVLLRTKLTAGEPLLFDVLPPPLQSLLRTTLLHALLSEPTRAVKLLIADSVAELASVLLYKADYPECVPFLARLIREGDSAHIVLALGIVGKLTDTLDTLVEHLPVLSPLLASSLSHPSVDVQVAAVHALCQLLSILEDDRQRKDHAKAFTPILSILVRLLQQRRDDDAVKVVGSLVEVVGEGDGDGLLMKAVMDRYALLMMLVACTGTPVMSTLTTSFPASALSPFMSLLPSASTPATAYSADLRHLAMEWTVSFAEDQPRLVRRSKTFITAALLSAFSLLLSVDEVAVQDWAQQTSDDEEESFDVGLVASDRLAEAIKGAKLTPVLLPFFHTLLASASWQYQHAGLRLLASTAAVLPFEEIPIPTVLSSLSSPHPRVRYAAVECLGQLADDFRPHLQEQYHAEAFTQLLPSLMAGEWPRLQSHACIAFFNLCVDLEEAIMARYAPQLLDVLLTLLTSAVRMVQEQVLATIAAIATAAPSLFTTYYPRVVPLIKHVIVEALGKDHAMLRARAMESLTMIGMSMKRDVFRADAIHLMHIFLAIMSNGGEGEEEKGRMGLAVDDVSEQFMLQAWTRICTVLGEEFTPMLERLLPVIFASAGQRVDVVVREEGGEGEDGRMDEFASSLEDKSNALSMLVSFCHDLTVGFFPYVQQTAAITIPLLAYPLSSDIRSYAITLMPLLVTSAVAAYKAQRCDLAYVKALMSAVVAGVLDRFKAEEETELLDALVRSLKECVVAVRDVGIARECLDGDGLGVVCDGLLRMLESSRLRIAAREKKMEEEEEDEEGMDEDSMVTMEAAIYEEDALHITIADCIGTLIQSHQAAFLPTFHRLTPELLSMLSASASLNSKRVSVFLFDDLIEYGGLTEAAAVDRLFASFLPHLLAYVALYPTASSSSSSSAATASGGRVTRQDASLRQACAYGLGVCAAAHPTAFAPYVDRTVSSLLAVIDDLPARLATDANSSSTDVDNCISALGKVAVMGVDGSQPYARLLSQWLFALPIRDDEEEGHAVYAQLVRLIEQHHARLFVDDRHALQVLYVLSSVVGSGFVNEEVNGKIVAVLGVMKRDMGMHGDAGTVKGRLKGMTVEQRQKVVDVLEAM